MIESLALNIAAEKSVQTAGKILSNLKDLAVSFQAAESAKGAVVRVPVVAAGTASAFDKVNNNYAGSSAGVSGVDIALDQHLVVSHAVSDTDLDETDVRPDYFAAVGEGIGRQIARGISKYALGKINKTNCAKETVLAAGGFDAEGLASIFAAADTECGMDPAECVLVLKPAVYAEVLANLPYTMHDPASGTQYGYIKGYMGFKAIMCSTDLDTAATEKLNGALIHEDALGIASRVLHCDPTAYAEVGVKADEASNVAIQFRRFADPATGDNSIAGTVIFGAALLQPGKVLRIVSAATA